MNDDKRIEDLEIKIATLEERVARILADNLDLVNALMVNIAGARDLLVSKGLVTLAEWNSAVTTAELERFHRLDGDDK